MLSGDIVAMNTIKRLPNHKTNTNNFVMICHQRSSSRLQKFIEKPKSVNYFLEFSI